jgi:hypothetical protein
MRSGGGGVSFATLLIGAGWILYVVSFFLPALLREGGTIASGLEAFLLSAMATAMFFQGLIWILPTALACVGNLAMALSPFEFVLPDRHRVFKAIPYALIALVPVNLLGLLVVPDGSPSPMSGFWLWEASYPMVAIGLFLRRKAARAIAASEAAAARAHRTHARPARPSAAGGPGRRVEPGLPG